MRKEFIKYSSFILLVLFLFPMVEKQVHAFEHITDTHCTANDKHFHEAEHHCDICDFTITDSNSSASIDYHFIISVNPFSFQTLIASVHVQNAFQNLPSRAPPIA
ncbi:MAG: hypothetical protein V4608_08310 [Bacteroidota bacterium]